MDDSIPPREEPIGREVSRLEALVTVPDGTRAEEFLDRCVVGSTWRARIRTAEVSAHVRARTPLGTFDERVCTCLSLSLELPVPVEPGLRFQLASADDPTLAATGVVRPWTS